MASNTRHLDTVCRIYKNLSGKVLAIDEIYITVNNLQLNAGARDDSGDLIQKLLVSVDTIKKSRTLLFLETPSSRVISSIQMIGNFTSLEDNSGNYLVAVWESQNTDRNDVEITFDQVNVGKVGESI